MNHFKTKVDLDLPADSSIMPRGAVSAESRSVVVSWSLEFEFREWGLKSLVYFAPDQEVEIDFYFITHGPRGEEDHTTETVSVKIQDIEVRTSVESHCLYPESLEWNEKTKKWILNF